MAYIGRDTDKLSNIEVLDVITFDGSSSYTLQKNSVNFTPSSANNVLVSIDGVVQANNFTVSGSTINFGVAVPSTSTCDWIYHIGVGLITTPADGTVGLAQLSATGTKDATTFLRGDNTFATPTNGFTLGTPVATTSGTSIDFTGIPSGTKLIIFSIQNCSTNGSDHIRIQIGDSGGVETSGYDCGLGEVGGGGYNTSGITDGLPIYLGNSARLFTTTVTITLINSSTNLYNLYSVYYGNNYQMGFSSGYKTLSATLDRIRLTGTAGGTFDSGSANIMYI